MNHDEPSEHVRPDAGTTRPRLTVLAGFHRDACQAVVQQLMTADPELLVVEHDLHELQGGVVRRTVRAGGLVLQDVAVALVHGCVSCTIREDVLPTLARLAANSPERGQVLVVPPSVEPDTVVAAAEYCLIDGAPLTDQVQIESVVTVVDADTILADTSTMEALDQRGRAAAGQDGRGVAETVIRQMEGADTILVYAVGVDRYRIAKATALSERLAPWARVLVAGPDAPGPTARLPLHGRLRGRIRYSPDVPEAVARGLAGFEVGECAHQPDCGVVSTLFHARRPFHPARLHAALPSLSGSALRVRGHSWISTQPDLVIGWDGAGGSLTLGTLDRWLAAVPDEQWPKAGPQRQVAATLEWDPYFGDRSTRLAFIGFELDTVQLHEQLQSCLLSDDELADGQERWSRLPDPFGDSFTAHEDPPVVDTRA